MVHIFLINIKNWSFTNSTDEHKSKDFPLHERDETYIYILAALRDEAATNATVLELPPL